MSAAEPGGVDGYDLSNRDLLTVIGIELGELVLRMDRQIDDLREVRAELERRYLDDTGKASR